MIFVFYPERKLGINLQISWKPMLRLNMFTVEFFFIIINIYQVSLDYLICYKVNRPTRFNQRPWVDV